MLEKSKNLYNSKVSSSFGSTHVTSNHIEEDAYIKCLDRYRRKVKNAAYNFGKEDSFIMAINKAYNREEISPVPPDGGELDDSELTRYLCLLNQGEKGLILSAPNELNLEVGKYFKWFRTNKIYLITNQYLTEKSYFKADVKECNFLLKWEDDRDNLYEFYAVVSGPPETRFKSEQESDFYMDRANDSIDVWLPQCAETAHLKRYSRIIIKDRAWTINIKDDITTSAIVKLNCVENYINKDKDTEDVVNGKDKVSYTLLSALDGLQELSVGKKLYFDPILIKEDKELDDINFNYSIIEMNNDSEDGEDVLVPGEGGFITQRPGTVRIEIKPDGYPVIGIYYIDIVPEEVKVDDTIVYRFGGMNKIRQTFTTTIVIEKYVNGEKLSVKGGEFVVQNNGVVKVIDKTENSVTLEGLKPGVANINFMVEDVDITSPYEGARIEEGKLYMETQVTVLSIFG